MEIGTSSMTSAKKLDSEQLYSQQVALGINVINMARPIQMTKATFIVLVVACVITLILSITFYANAKDKVVYSCDNESAADKVLQDAARSACINGWSGELRMQDGHFKANCN
jgi:hypothetical protein